jgi:hypothetical protein
MCFTLLPFFSSSDTEHFDTVSHRSQTAWAHSVLCLLIYSGYGVIGVRVSLFTLFFLDLRAGERPAEAHRARKVTEPDSGRAGPRHVAWTGCMDHRSGVSVFLG